MYWKIIDFIVTTAVFSTYNYWLDASSWLHHIVKSIIFITLLQIATVAAGYSVKIAEAAEQ